MRNGGLWLLWAAALLANPAAATRADEPDPRGRFVEARLTGEFGREITAPGVTRVFELAKVRQAGVVVFVIDSPGGRVADAEAIAKVLDEARSDFQIVVVVKRAISASVWVMAQAHHLVFQEGAAAGAAVVFSTDSSTGHADVDAKMNAAIAGELAARAERSGQSGAVYRAMVLREAELFACAEPDGRVRLVNEAPPDGPAKARTIDTAETVLTLTSRQAEELGIARQVTGPDDPKLPAMLGLDRWVRAVEASNVQAVMKVGADDVARAAANTERAVASLKSAIGKEAARRSQIASLVTLAEQAHPEQISVWYRDSTGMLTPASQIRWRDQTDTAVRRWRDVQSALEDVRRLQTSVKSGVKAVQAAHERETKARGVRDSAAGLEPPDYTETNADFEVIWTQSRQQIAELLARRTRYRIDQ